MRCDTVKLDLPKPIRWGLSSVLILVLIVLSDPVQLLERVRSLSLEIIGLLLGMLILQLFILCLVYWRVIRMFSDIKLIPFAQHYLMGWSTEFFLPGKLGAFSIAYLLRKEKVPLGVGVASVMFIKFMTLALMMGIIVLGLPSQFYKGLDVTTALGLVALALILFAAIFFTMPGRSFMRRIMARFGAEKFAGFGHALTRLWKNPVMLIQTGAGLFLSMLVGATILSLVYGSYGFSVSVIQLLVILSLALLAGAIPISLNGIGVKEGITVLLLVQLGVPISLAVTISAVNSGIGLLFGFVLGVVLAHALPNMVASATD